VGPYDNLPDMAAVTPQEMNILKAFTALYSWLHVPSYKIRSPSDSSAPDTEESDDDTDSTTESTNHSHYTTATDVTSASSSDVTHMSSDSDESDPDSDSDGDVALGDQAVGVHHANGAQHAIAIPIAAARIRRRKPP
jgi:hypothetical protein